MSKRHTDMMTRFREGELSRRQLGKYMASLGVVSVTLPLCRTAAAAEQPLFYTWSGYDAPDLYKPYVAKHKEMPRTAIMANQEEALQKMLAGYVVDVGHPSIDDMIKWHDSGLLQPIDTSRLKNWSSVFPELQNLAGVSFDGNVLMIPTDLGNASILYRSDIYEGEETWGMLFDERYQGKISPWRQKYNVYAAATILGLDMFDVPDDKLKGPILDLLRKQRDVTRFYWDDPSQAEQAMASGEVVLMHAWNSSYANLVKQGVPVKYAKPKEGIWTWVSGLVRIKGGEANDEAAYDLIDNWISPETGQFLLDVYGLAHSNKRAYELVSKERLEALALSDPATMLKESVFFRPLKPEIDLRYIKLWEDVQAGL
jgi:spermidine/putrescine transport system substrate-binding protein